MKLRPSRPTSVLDERRTNTRQHRISFAKCNCLKLLLRYQFLIDQKFDKYPVAQCGQITTGGNVKTKRSTQQETQIDPHAYRDLTRQPI
jgi:hypothetical protein